MKTESLRCDEVLSPSQNKQEKLSSKISLKLVLYLIVKAM